MIKSFIIYMLYLPLIYNLLIIFLMMLPSKIFKFHPLNLMLILIQLILLISMKMYYLTSSIMSLILFLIMIGGLMVIFMYITSLANNELFFMNFKLIIINLLKITPLMIFIMYIYLNYNKLLYFNNNYQNYYNQFNLYNSEFMNISLLYMKLNNNATYFIMIYLYYTMICVMNICYKFKAPMRQIMY